MPSDYLEKILVTDILRKSVIQEAISSLNLPKASKGFDAGCGAGLQSILLAEAIGSEGHVTGLDISSEFIVYARKIAKDLKHRITFKEGTLKSLPFPDNTFDWAWSSDCIGYGTMEPEPVLKELIRVIKPGGTIAILAWSSERLLPGHPVLEAKLNATSPGIAPFSSEMEPSRHFLRSLGLLRKMGLKNCKADIFAGKAHAPLSTKQYSALKAMLEMRWPDVLKELSFNDAAEYSRLCNPDSPDFILRLPDYYAFFTVSLFCGTV